MGSGASAHDPPTHSKSRVIHPSLLSTSASGTFLPEVQPHPVRALLGRLKVSIFISSWFVFSIASLFVAKHVLHTYQINEAVFTLWQFASSVLYGILFTKVFRFHKLSTLSRSQLRAVVPLSAAFLVKEVLKYASLARVSVNLVNTIRSLGPLFNIMLEFFLFTHWPPQAVIWSLVPIVLGVAMTTADEIHTASVSGPDILPAIAGLIAAISSTAINNAQNIYSKVLFGRERIDPPSLQIYLSAISLVIMSPVTVAQFAYHAVTSDDAAHTFFAPSIKVALALAFAGLVNFVASQLAFNTLNLITPLSYSVANTFKRVCIAVIAIFYFKERLSPANGFGIAISIIGLFIYERKVRHLREAKMYKRSNSDIRPGATLPTRKQTASGPDLVKLGMEASQNFHDNRQEGSHVQHYKIDVSLTPTAASRTAHTQAPTTKGKALQSPKP